MTITTICRMIAARIGAAGRDQTGATAVEYAIIIALIAGVIILAVAALGLKTGANFSKIIDAWE